MPTLPLKAQAQATLQACVTLYDVEARQHRPWIGVQGGHPGESQGPTPVERQQLQAFTGFGMLANDVFPDPTTGGYKDATWELLGTSLKEILTPEDYDSAARSTYTAFYTSRLVMRTLFLALKHLGVPDDATVLEPGCGSGNFFRHAPPAMHFVGIEQEALSCRIARLLYPQHDLRLSPIQRTSLAPQSVDAVIGNVPFARETTPYWGMRLRLHELCVAKGLDALRPGGILGLVVTHFLLDRTNDRFRQEVASRAEFLGAIRLPAEAFAAEGTRVVTDLLFLRKAGAGTPAAADPTWLKSLPLAIEGVDVPVSAYFHAHPAQVLGTWTRDNALYGAETSYSVKESGVLAEQLVEGVLALPAQVYGVDPLAHAVPQARTQPTLSRAAQVVALPEGSFFVWDKQICQIQQGNHVPVLYGGTALSTQGKVGARAAALIGLRDATRAVLRVQEAEGSLEEREDARDLLRRLYQAFVRAYGPINTVTLTTLQDGTVQRRLPNLTVFRDDPDAMLVMAIEVYNEQTGQATPAPIQMEDVLAPPVPITQVSSAAEGLLVVLSTTGRPDLAAIADLYGEPESVVLQELGDLLYHDPASHTWETADVYLSGEVKQKLAEARAATVHDPAYERNVLALDAVQPADLLPGEIEASLPSPWIPEDVILQFAQELFCRDQRTGRVEAWKVRVARASVEALWSVVPVRSARDSAEARTQYGTARVDGFTLLEQALNLQFPTIYDPVPGTSNPTRYTVNPVETEAAREKQRLLQDTFKEWLFADAARAERLVRLYNDSQNTTRQREFSGAHLEFPGMTPLATLRPEQKDAIWRIMTNGNTLLAHAVGAGKTWIMFAAAMKMQQMGLLNKPLFVVPNHMLEQFGRECQFLYPNARILLAPSEDFTKERRKLQVAKMVAQDWDAIITTHSAFEYLDISPDFTARFLRELIAEYATLLTAYDPDDPDGARRTIRKRLEQAKSAYETELRELLEAKPRDDGLLFDQIRIGGLFLDECQKFKNLTTPTKMTRVAGIKSDGAQRSMDLLLKLRYLDTLHPGHGVVFASGTPVSNTMTELYVMQKYLTPAALAARGLAHFDAWAACYGRVTQVMEVSPDGRTFHPRHRFNEFINMPELLQQYLAFADVKTADQLKLPRPQLGGGMRQEMACPLSDQGRFLQDDLVDQYAQVKNGQLPPWVALQITTAGRKLALDPRLLSAHAADDPASKLHVCIAQVLHHYHASTAYKGAQLIFADLGVKPTPWGFSFYETIIAGLVAAGIPRAEIARVDSAKNDQQKASLFANVRAGHIRVLIGSTERMGMGTNVQTRLVALHHLDVPWKPSEIEQREGRILRPGNLHLEWGLPVWIYCYVTAGSFDAVMWQANQTKAHFVRQLLSGQVSARTADDIGEQELSFARLKALACGNPAMLTLAEAQVEVRRLDLLKKHHRDAHFQSQMRQKSLPQDLARQERYLAQLTADRDVLAAWQGQEPLTIDAQPCSAAAALPLLTARAQPLLLTKRMSGYSVPLGTYKGQRFGMTTNSWGLAEVWLQGEVTRRNSLSHRTSAGQGILDTLEELDSELPARVAQAEAHLAHLHEEGRTIEVQLATPFTLLDYRNELETLRGLLEAALAADGDASRQPLLVQEIEALRTAARHQPQAEARTTPRVVSVAPAIVPLLLEQHETQDAAA